MIRNKKMEKLRGESGDKSRKHMSDSGARKKSSKRFSMGGRSRDEKEEDIKKLRELEENMQKEREKVPPLYFYYLIALSLFPYDFSFLALFVY